MKEEKLDKGKLLEEAVKEGETGLLFTLADADDLAAKARELIGDAQRYQRLCVGARQLYESKHSPAQHYQALMNCYHLR